MRPPGVSSTNFSVTCGSRHANARATIYNHIHTHTHTPFPVTWAQDTPTHVPLYRERGPRTVGRIGVSGVGEVGG
jgi:hypothetical protein